MLFLLLLLWGEPKVHRFSLETEDFALQPHVSGLRVDDGGLIYVADLRENTIRVFDETGTHLRNIGRRGEGPGEFKRWFGGFSIVGEKLIQYDYFEGNRFINIFGLDGQLLNTVNLSGLPPSVGPRLILPWGEVRFLIMFDHDYRGRKQGPLYFFGPMQTLAEMDDKGKLGKHLFDERATYEVSKFPDREGRAIPGSDETLIAISLSRHLAVKQRENAGEGEILDLRSGNKRVFKNGFQRKPVTEDMVVALQKERAAWVKPRWRSYEAELYRSFAGFVEQMDLFTDIIETIFFTSQGLIVVGNKGPDGQVPFHLIDHDTGEITRRDKRNFAPFHMTANRIYGLEADEEEDVYHVIIAGYK